MMTFNASRSFRAGSLAKYIGSTIIAIAILLLPMVNANLALAAEVVWVDDATPRGAALEGTGETWIWVQANPAAFSGGSSHQSTIAAGIHQHYFYDTLLEDQLAVSKGDKLFAYVYLDPANPPSQIMLQWNDGSWEHRAYWGANSVGWGVDGTDSRRYMGTLPPAGQWVRLEVLASQVGLEGRSLNGMAFTLYDGRATWDRAGKDSGSATNTPPTISLTAPTHGATYTAPAAITLTATATDNDGTIAKVEFYNGATLLGTTTASPYTLALSGVAAGTYNYTAKAYDNLNASVVSTVATVTVGAVNAPPSITALTATPQTLLDTASSQLQVVASDPDAGPSPLNYSWSIVSGGGSLSSSTMANPVYTPANVSAPTSAVIKVTVSDGAAAASQNITLTVNDTPVVATVTITYYHNDALGSPIAATGPTGNLLWRESYRPYGERLDNQPAGATNPIWYTGKRQDPETGLVYMGARYYNPALGRFLSIDPVEPDENNLHSLNRYAYANNNPYKFTDPDGQIAETVIDVISLGLSLNAYRQDPSFINGLALAYDGLATAVPFLPGGIGIIRQAATKGGAVTQAVKQAADKGAAKAGESTKNGVHKNSLDYVGETHVYRIKGPDNKNYKIGESAQGTRKADGASIRAEQQARKLSRETGGRFESEIRKTFPDKASARDYETRVIERFRGMHGDNALPGNKTNR